MLDIGDSKILKTQCLPQGIETGKRIILVMAHLGIAKWKEKTL